MDTIKHILIEILQGFIDSIKGISVIFYLDREVNKRLHQKFEKDIENKTFISDSLRTGATIGIKTTNKKTNESNVLKRILNCCLLNAGLCWFSIIIFEKLLLPGINLVFLWLYSNNSGVGSTIWSWMHPFLSLLFRMIWVLPLYLLSRIVNSIWFQDIANSAYEFRQGRRLKKFPISTVIADILISLIIELLFLIQSMVVSVLPINYLGSILCFVHMCLLYSLYSFEYKWFNAGWELHKRLTYIEHNWPYFMGFGMPLVILTQLPQSTVISGCVFATLFPFFILSATEAIPKENSRNSPLKLFSLVVAISNKCIRTTMNTNSSVSTIKTQPLLHNSNDNHQSAKIMKSGRNPELYNRCSNSKTSSIGHSSSSSNFSYPKTMTKTSQINYIR